MVQRGMVRFGCIHGVTGHVLLARRSILGEFAWGLVAFLEGGNLLRNVVLLNGEVFRVKARDIVPFAIRDGNIELYKNNVYPKTRCFVLGSRPRYRGQRQKETKAPFEACESSV